MSKPLAFDLSTCVVFDLEVFPRRWCVGFRGFDHSGQLSSKVIETRDGLERILAHFAQQGRTLIGYNSDRFDAPLICAILKSIDPYAPAQHIIRENRLPDALKGLPAFPCDHIDISARLRRGGTFAGLKTVAANIGRPVLRELPFDPDAILTDVEWEEVGAYNRIDLEHTWALLERLAPEISALTSLSQEIGVDLRSVSTPQVVERFFRGEYRRVHGEEPVRRDAPDEVRYVPGKGVLWPKTKEASDWAFKIANEPIPMISRGERKVPGVPSAKFTIGKLTLSVGSGGLHSADLPRVYY